MSNHTPFKVVMDTLILSGMTFDQALNLVADLIREEAPLLHRNPSTPKHGKKQKTQYIANSELSQNRSHDLSHKS